MTTYNKMVMKPYSYNSDDVYDRYWDWDSFGLGATPEEIHQLAKIRHNIRARRAKLQESEPIYGKDGFEVKVDVLQFRPDEIYVTTVDNNLIIEGKHGERPDQHGYISRQFNRKYILPREYNVNEIESSLSSDGILTVKAPPLPPPRFDSALERILERKIPIKRVGPVHLSIKYK